MLMQAYWFLLALMLEAHHNTIYNLYSRSKRICITKNVVILEEKFEREKTSQKQKEWQRIVFKGHACRNHTTSQSSAIENKAIGN